jgi:hypothetical protein
MVTLDTWRTFTIFETMEDFGKIILYAIGILLYGLYNFIKNKKKADTKAPSTENPEAKPFISPAANPEAKARPVISQPSPEVPSSLEDLLRRFTTEQQPAPPPMLEDKVRSRNRKPALESRSLETIAPENRSLEGASYDQEIPQYYNEANEVDYEIPERATYKGLDDATHSRFKEFEKTQETVNPYTELLQNSQSVRDAFVLSEIFKRKEW